MWWEQSQGTVRGRGEIEHAIETRKTATTYTEDTQAGFAHALRKRNANGRHRIGGCRKEAHHVAKGS